jgi:hypothetical protein
VRVRLPRDDAAERFDDQTAAHEVVRGEFFAIVAVVEADQPPALVELVEGAESRVEPPLTEFEVVGGENHRVAS